VLNYPGLLTDLSLVESYVTINGSVGQCVLEYSTHLGLTTSSVFFFTWGALSDERTGLSFTIVAGPRQRIRSRVRVPWDSSPYFTVSDSRIPFCRLLRLPGLRWRYSTPPPHGIIISATTGLRYIGSARTTQKTLLLLLSVDHTENKSRYSYLANPLAR
jgi:hypothetical protein